MGASNPSIIGIPTGQQPIGGCAFGPHCDCSAVPSFFAIFFFIFLELKQNSTYYKGIINFQWNTEYTPIPNIFPRKYEGNLKSDDDNHHHQCEWYPLFLGPHTPPLLHFKNLTVLHYPQINVPEIKNSFFFFYYTSFPIMQNILVPWQFFFHFFINHLFWSI